MTYGAVEQLALVETYVGTDGLTRVRDSFRFTPSFGAVYYDSVDLGFPEVRGSSQGNPGADGTYDETRYTGARSVAISGKVLQNAFRDAPARYGWDPQIGWNSASWFIRYLSAWAYPARRSRLYFTDDSGAPKFLDVRGDSFTAPIDKASANVRDWQMGFINPSGKVYSLATGEGATADGRFRTLIRQSSIDLPGRIYPEPAPYVRNYPTLPIGGTAVQYRGSVPNGFIANVYTASRAMTDPRLTVTAPDGSIQSIGISGYSVPANSVITFDTTERTINTSLGDSLDQFKTAPLQWPQLRPGFSPGQTPGRNGITLTVTASAPDAYVEILWNDADLA